MSRVRWRPFTAGLCGALGVIALVLGVLLGYFTRALFNSEAFSAHVAASLAEPGVATYVGGKIADGVIAAKPDLIGLRPMIIAGSSTVVASGPFRAAAMRGARRAHHAIMSGTGEQILLSVDDVSEILKAALALNPEIAAKLPPRLTATLARVEDVPAAELGARLARAVRRARVGSLALIIVGLGLLVGSAAIANDRRRVFLRAGVAMAIAAAMVWIIARYGGIVAGMMPHDPDLGRLALGLWNGFATGLTKWAMGLGLVGLVLASASSEPSKRGYVADTIAAAWRWLTTPPPNAWQQFLRGLGVVVVALCALSSPRATLDLLALLAGGVFAYIGLRECFSAILHFLPEMEPKTKRASRQAGGPSFAARVSVVGAIGLAVVAVAVWYFARTPDEPPVATAITACNGSPLLCDRRLDQVVFPTTHNSMSGADVTGWMFPNQNKGIGEQLEDGVRGFLIDAHYGMPVGDRIKTLLDDNAASMAKYEAVVGKEGMEAAMRIRDRLVGGDESERGVYMAHGFCELGATSLVSALTEMRDFLVQNPGEILILVVQDEGVSPADIQKCFEESGLIEFVYLGPAKPPWPTLREMAESDQRVLVMAENETGDIPWYHPAFEVLQETPYTFRDSTEFSNKPNRGGKGGSLLLMNHWIESTPMPKPSNASFVNRYDFLLRRARACERLRRHLPNLIAVDFYSTGDLLRVARTLNGLDPPPQGPRRPRK